MFSEAIIEVIKNPRAYLDAHYQSFLEGQEDYPLNTLILLLSASANFEFDEIFFHLDHLIVSSGLLEDHLEYQYFYHRAHATYNRSLGIYDEAMSHAKKTYNLGLIMDEASKIAKALMLMSTIFDASGDGESALKYAKNALKKVPNMSHPIKIAELYLNYGVLLNHQDQSLKAIDAFILALDYFKNHPGYAHYLNYCISLLNIGKTLLKVHDNEAAKDYLSECVERAEKENFMAYLHSSIKEIADFFVLEGDLHKANQMLRVYADQQSLLAKNKAKRIMDKHRKELVPHLDYLHALHEKNNQLNQALETIKSSMNIDDQIFGKKERLLIEISEGLQNKGFVPYLQSKWSVGQKKIVGAEILARWQKPSGLISGPGDFIEAMENTDFICSLTESLLHDTLEAISTYIKNENPNFKIGFNVSPYQLVHQNLVHLLELCCITYHLKPKNFEVEIIERTFIENNPLAIDQLFNLAQKGFNIALDDFGSGYSSLGCIVSLPIHTVKIDRSLVKDIHQNHRSERLFRSIVAMVKELNLITVAEGIETEDHLLVIKDTGCDEGQGYLMDKPCPLDKLFGYLINKDSISIKRLASS